MSDPYIGEIRMFGGNFPPVGWAFCNGQLMAISENDALFTLIGTTYGGDGQSTFGLPNLQGRIPLHMGTNPGTGTTYTIGELAGVENVTLNTNQIPIHNHPFIVSAANGDTPNPGNAYVGSSTNVPTYVPQNPTAALAGTTLAATGGSQPHDNMMPFLAVSFIISLFGIFPTQN
jgi:microcystin-dependent protein